MYSDFIPPVHTGGSVSDDREYSHLNSASSQLPLRRGFPGNLPVRWHSYTHRCDCSFCKRKGAIVAAVHESDLKVIRGETAIVRYQFGKRVTEHFLCGNCGIYTHHRRSTNPQEFGFNIGCLEGINPYDLDAVPVAWGCLGLALSPV